MKKNKLNTFMKPLLIFALLGGVYYVGSHLEFEDPFVPAPIYKGLSMTLEEQKKNPLKAVSLTKEAVKLQYKVAGDLTRILDEQGIDYWLGRGSLLGAVRHEGAIPYDDDVDLFFKDSDAQKVLALKSVLKKVGLGIYQDRTSIKVYKLDGCHVRPKRKSFKIFSGVWFVRRKKERFPCIDLCPAKLENGEFMHANSRALRIWPNERFKEEDIFPLKEYPFGPLKLKGPQNPVFHLNSSYGSDWDKYLVFSYNHTISNGIRFKIPFVGDVKAYCYRYGVKESS